MIIVSSRDKFWDSDRISGTKDAIQEIDLNSDTRQRKMRDLDIDIFKNEVSGKKVLFLVHGYNNRPGDVIAAYRKIESMHNKYTKYYDLIIGYSWPGGDHKLEYFFAKDRAKEIYSRFKNLLLAVKEECGEIGIMSHSMGSRVALLALNEIGEDGIEFSPKMTHYLTASAVDNETIELDDDYGDATSVSDSYIFHSRYDSVLRKAYRLAEWDYALGLTGPEDLSNISPNTYVINCKRAIRSHGGYKKSKAVFDAIKSIKEQGENFAKFSHLK